MSKLNHSSKIILLAIFSLMVFVPIISMTSANVVTDGDLNPDVYIDSEPPTISNVVFTPQNPDDLHTVTISADIDDNNAVSSAMIYYGFSGDTSNSTGMTYTGTGITYTVDLGPYEVGENVTFYIFAVDYDTNSATDDNDGFLYSFVVVEADLEDPVISNIDHGRTSENMNATITCTITDDTETTGFLWYRKNWFVWKNETMVKDGTTYTAILDKYNYQDVIEYYIVAIDSAVEPNIAIDDNESSYYTFTIEKYDTTPPTISNTYLNPEIPEKDTTVIIGCTIMDDYFGIEEAKIYYRVNGGSWVIVDMELVGDKIYEAAIGTFDTGDLVEYYFTAMDNSTSYNELIWDNSGSYYHFEVLRNSNATSLYFLPTIFALATVSLIILKRRKH
jgi:hypothetical protein